jgi:hypothetical protein
MSCGIHAWQPTEKGTTKRDDMLWNHRRYVKNRRTNYE